MQAQLSSLDAAITTEITNVGKRLGTRSTCRLQRRNLCCAISSMSRKNAAYQLNEHAIQYAVLKHEVENGRELYDTLQLKLKMAGVTAGLNSSYISVVDPAEMPDTPVSQTFQSNLIIGLFGGLISRAAACVWGRVPR